ncbi:MAG: hypothetical protein ACT4NY_05710 [Pseudonocardiales bacterium]
MGAMVMGLRARWSRLQRPHKVRCYAPYAPPELPQDPLPTVEDGRDYTGWAARFVSKDGPIPVGSMGVVTGFTQTPDRYYTVTFTCCDLTTDVVTRLPAPTDMDLIAPLD